MLSIVLGLVLSPRGAPGVAALYAHLLGRPYVPHDPERYNAPLREHLLACHPGLATFRAAEVPTYEFAGDWVRRRACEFGTYLVVPPVPASRALDGGVHAVDASEAVHAAAAPGPSVDDQPEPRPAELWAAELWEITPTPHVPSFAPTPGEDGPAEAHIVPDGL